jgi:hypothetical protein
MMLMCSQKSYRLIIRDVIRDFGTILRIGKRVLLQTRLRRICGCTGAQTHDTISNLEPLRHAVPNSAYNPNNILAEYSR